MTGLLCPRTLADTRTGPLKPRMRRGIAEVLHGPAAIVQAHFPTLVLGVEDAALPQVVETAERMAASGADMFLTGAEARGAMRLPSVAGRHPLVLIASYDAFVEQLARRRGFDPDTPPHLRKVTETT